ncbi:hypothetical protein BDV98DRAFT_563936 [Pterulicium gracile]|uniref:Uncharacterized protein n=1 Tax=Pterulicium gracile TaxID=1884261 RepID=A0A5C3QSK0_9AGAR|nr:hypothetical protein BDV98DRAFT_563936 [Pterula gracilis]
MFSENLGTAQNADSQGVPKNSVLFDTSNVPKPPRKQPSNALPTTTEDRHVRVSVRSAHLSPLPWSDPPSTPQSESHGEPVTTPNGDTPARVDDQETAPPVIDASIEIESAGAEVNLMTDDVISITVPFESFTDRQVWENTSTYLVGPMHWWELCDGGAGLREYAAECPPLNHARSPYGRIPLPALFMLDDDDDDDDE